MERKIVCRRRVICRYTHGSPVSPLGQRKIFRFLLELEYVLRTVTVSDCNEYM